MSFVLGAGGPLSALTLMDQSYPGWLLVFWTMGLGVLGILLAVSLRNKLIVVEDAALPDRHGHRRGDRDDPRRAPLGDSPGAPARRGRASRRCTSPGSATARRA